MVLYYFTGNIDYAIVLVNSVVNTTQLRILCVVFIMYGIYNPDMTKGARLKVSYVLNINLPSYYHLFSLAILACMF